MPKNAAEFASDYAAPIGLVLALIFMGFCIVNF